jgi:hypothetical protein
MNLATNFNRAVGVVHIGIFHDMVFFFMNFRRKKDSFRCVASPTKACGGARTADHDKPAENLAREARPARWPDALTAQSGARTRVSRCCVLGQVGIHAAEVSSSGSGYAKPVALAAAHVFALVCAFVVWWPMAPATCGGS